MRTDILHTLGKLANMICAITQEQVRFVDILTSVWLFLSIREANYDLISIGNFENCTVIRSNETNLLRFIDCCSIPYRENAVLVLCYIIHQRSSRSFGFFAGGFSPLRYAQYLGCHCFKARSMHSAYSPSL